MINAALRFLTGINSYYIRFGIRGWLYLLRRANKFSSIIKFSHPNYKFPVYIRNNTSDIGVFKQILLKQDYHLNIRFKPKVIFDLGANIGLAAVYFKNKYPWSEIISIEPEASNFKMLRKNTEYYSGIKCYQAGIWNKNTNLIIKNIGNDKWGFMVEEANDSTVETIKALSIEALMKDSGINEIDILKIDIEGSEKELFEKNYEYWLSRTKVIIIELHDHLRAGSSKAFFKALDKYDFSLSRRGENLIIYLNK